MVKAESMFCRAVVRASEREAPVESTAEEKERVTSDVSVRSRSVKVMEPAEVRRASEALRVRGAAAESPPEEVLEVEREKGTPGVSAVMVISEPAATALRASTRVGLVLMRVVRQSFYINKKGLNLPEILLYCGLVHGITYIGATLL